jgi:hypothetical protein
MKSSRFFLCVILSGITLAASNSSKAQVAHLTLQSQPGDFIGQGGNFDITYTPANSLFFFVSLGSFIGSPPMPAEVHFVLGDPTAAFNTFTTLDFGTNQLGIPLQPGFYPNAEREAFASPGHPGLDVTFQNRGSNTLTGNFTIIDITFGPNNVLETFAVSFEQHSEGATPALFGTFTYDANAIPEPSTWAMMFGGVGMLAAYASARRRGHTRS